MKRIWSLIITVVILLSAFIVTPMEASAAERVTKLKTFLSPYGQGYNHTTALNNAKSSGYAQDRIYMWYVLVDGNTGDLLNSYASYDYDVYMAIYDPNGDLVYDTNYTGSHDANWIGIVPQMSGTYTATTTVSGDINGSHTAYYDVSYDAELVSSRDSVSLNLNGTNTQTIEITPTGGFPGEKSATVFYDGSYVSVSSRWSNGKMQITLTGVKVGDKSIRVELYEGYTGNNNLVAQITIPVYITANRYTVSYNANGGSGAPSSQTKDYGTNITLSTTVPTRNGYTFLGWSTSSTASSATYLPGSTFSSNANTTLYAVWKSATTISVGSSYSAKINFANQEVFYAFTPASSGLFTFESTGSVDSKVFLYDTSGTLLGSDDDSSDEGYNFKLTKSLTGGTKYYVKVRAYNENVGTISFSTIGQYTVTYNANGGSGAPADQTKIHGTNLTLSTGSPKRSGYIFKGWGTSSTATTVSYQPGGTYSSNSNLTLYAIWTPADTTKPTVSISSTNNVSSSQTVTLSMNDDVGVVSYYWGTSSNPSSSSYTTITSTKSTSIQKTVSSSGTYYLIAKDAAGNVSSTASITYYNTTFDANGGSVSPTSVLTKSSNSFTPPTPTRFGYKFKGWSTSSVATSGSTTITPTSNTTYYAIWQAPTSLSVNTANTASISSGGEMKYYSFTPSTSGKYVIYSTANTDTKVYLYDSDGIELNNDDDSGDSTNFRLEYNLTSGETYYFGVKYYDSSNIGSISFTFGRVYTVTYNANGGSDTPLTQYKDFGKSLTLSSDEPSKNNYLFAGWGTSSGSTSASYQPGGTYSTESNVTLYAIWTPADTTKPTVSISSTNNVSSSQTATLSLSDNVGVVSYYWGTNSNPSSSSFTTISSTASTQITKTVSSSGTYYLIVKDAAGNTSTTATATFYTITLNANGGTVSPSSILTKSGNTVTLPTPVRNSYKYLGWNVSSTATSGSLSVSVTSNRTYYAVWEYIHTCSFTGEEEIVVDATCTENGSKLVHCTEPSCSKVQTVVIEAYGHSEGEWEVVKPVACLENGMKERRCPDCDHLFESEMIYSTGHSMGEWYVYRNPEFHTQGEERKDCANCDYFDYKFIPATSVGHQCDFTGEEEIVFAATCTESGSKKIYCFEPECGEYILETIESFGHSLGDWQVYKAAKFHEEGEERKTCEHCSYFEYRPIPKTSIGHKCKFTGEEEFIDRATCLNDGSKKVFCFEPECGKYKEVEVKRTGHNISDWTVYTEVQFHIDGEERKTCANCGFYESRVIPKLSESHTCSFTGRVNVVFEPTCTETGLKKTYCIELECGKYLTETPEALGHTESEFTVVKDATCTEDGTKQQKCTVCDEILKTEVITAYGHEYNVWTVIKEATDTEVGEKTRECFICHYVESEIVDPLVPTTTPDEEKTDLGLLGDVNGDGKVNIKDATMIQKAAAKITALSDDEKLRADVNADTKNNVKDATAIQKFVAKIETGYPIGEKIK